MLLTVSEAEQLLDKAEREQDVLPSTFLQSSQHRDLSSSTHTCLCPARSSFQKQGRTGVMLHLLIYLVLETMFRCGSRASETLHFEQPREAVDALVPGSGQGQVGQSSE